MSERQNKLMMSILTRLVLEVNNAPYEARKKDKSITMNDINDFFKKNVEQKRRPVGTNSFIAYEYQVDFFFSMTWRTKSLRWEC